MSKNTVNFLITIGMMCWLTPVSAKNSVAQTSLSIAVIHEAIPRFELTFAPEPGQTNPMKSKLSTDAVGVTKHGEIRTNFQQNEQIPCSFDHLNRVEQAIVRQTLSVTGQCLPGREIKSALARVSRTPEADGLNQESLNPADNLARLTIVFE